MTNEQPYRTFTIEDLKRAQEMMDALPIPPAPDPFPIYFSRGHWNHLKTQLPKGINGGDIVCGVRCYLIEDSKEDEFYYRYDDPASRFEAAPQNNYFESLLRDPTLYRQP